MTTSVAPERYAAPRVSIFNHKGGVGKTTLTVNLAAAIAETGRRVLLVDSDPQCNLTSYLVEDAVVNDLLDTSDTGEGRTVWSALKPIVEATGEIRAISPIELRNNLLLVPGDIRLAEFEEELGQFWTESLARKLKGFRGTTALSQLVNSVARDAAADIVFYDSGPNIGALNRTILLDSDFFAIPAACDLFSLRAIKTLGHTLADWITSWDTIDELAPDGLYLLPGRPKLLGLIPQRFRVYARRPATDAARFMPLLEKAVRHDVAQVLREIDPMLVPESANPLIIGEIKDFGTRAATAQRDGVPIADLEGRDTRNDARDAFAALAGEMARRVFES